MTGSDNMVWESPPPPGHGYDWEEIAERLKQNPGEWLRVFENGPVTVVNAIRMSTIRALTPIRPARTQVSHEGFEVRTRNNQQGPPRTATLYLRWVPGRGA